MNSLSQKDISGQLFYLSKEAVKTIVLNSKCGILSSFRASKKSSSTNDISILNNFSPLICLYRKASPVFIHSKTSHGFDESSFKKEINPSTNALMTLCLLELSDYYGHYQRRHKHVTSLEKSYIFLCKEQLDFYSENLRNSEGVFIKKKNISEGNAKGYNLIEKDKKFNFSDQAFMMNAYYLYSLYNPEDPVSSDYKSFSLQILDMFFDFKEALYNISFDEGCMILLAFNVFYDFSKEERCKTLLIDLSDFLINKFDEKDYYVNSLDSCCMLAISLEDSFKHTDIIAFKEKSNEIFDKLEGLYDEENGIFLKLTDKKDIKYSSLEISFYFLAILLHSRNKDSSIDSKNMISSLYKKYFINSGIVSSWPDAPTLDEVERYRGLSLNSEDMLDESFFRMPNLPSPESSGIAPIFVKNITYSRKKDSFTRSKDSFDSDKNMLIFFTFIYYLKDEILGEMNFNNELNLLDSINRNEDSTFDESEPLEDINEKEDEENRENLLEEYKPSKDDE
ncbi:hypothetical protein [Clostridium paraputrificum]|uniref:hypothetical protein n=1 Tax=Clostridium paraputrificum TaxID=29363 RepID=UPI003D328177